MERDARRVLLVMPDPEAVNALATGFAFHGMETSAVSSGADALAAVSSEAPPDLVVMDLALPDTDGLVLVGDLRARTRAPIIVCGNGEERSEALLVFRLGADDFVARPIEVDDVVARAEVALRRLSERESVPEVAGAAGAAMAGGAPGGAVPQVLQRRGAEESEMVVGDLALDMAHHRVLVGGEEVRLSRSEYLLLSALMSRPDELLSRLELARAVWGEQLAQIGRPIDQHMYRLRSKLQAAARKAGVETPSIASVPGFGYRLLAQSAEQRAAA